MVNLKQNVLFRIIATALILAFISFDISYAYPADGYRPGNSALSAPTICTSADPRSIAKLNLAGSMLTIARELFGDPENKKNL